MPNVKFNSIIMILISKMIIVFLICFYLTHSKLEQAFTLIRHGSRSYNTPQGVIDPSILIGELNAIGMK